MDFVMFGGFCGFVVLIWAKWNKCLWVKWNKWKFWLWNLVVEWIFFCSFIWVKPLSPSFKSKLVWEIGTTFTKYLLDRKKIYLSRKKLMFIKSTLASCTFVSLCLLLSYQYKSNKGQKRFKEMFYIEEEGLRGNCIWLIGKLCVLRGMKVWVFGIYKY